MSVIAQEGRSLYARTGGRLPPYCAAGSVLGEVLDILSPPSRMSPVEAAVQYRKMNEKTFRGDWNPQQVPYMTEPMDTVTSRLYRGMVFVGSARSGKTDSLVLNTILHNALCAPSKMLLVNLDQKTGADYSTDEVDRMIRDSRALAARVETGAGARTMYQKLFKGGGRLKIGWPVIGFFAQKTIPLVMITDRDRMKDSIDGEGDPFQLGMKRGETLGSLAMCIEESSPGREVKVKDWKPQTIHEAAPCDGILGDYNLGTRGRYYWRCPSCGDEFQPRFSSISWNTKAGDHQQQAMTAFMRCDNGCVITQAQKRDLNIAGRWLHESQCGTMAVPLDHPEVRQTDIASWWQLGPIARAQTWPSMVLKWLQAIDAYDRTMSEEKLKVTTNVDHGEPYLSKLLANESELTPDELWNRASVRPLGIIPAKARCFAYHVDVQDNRFVVQAVAIGPDLEMWVVDRFDITVPPENAPGGERDETGNPRRQLMPPRYLEDWAVLEHLEARALPIAESDFVMRPYGVTYDSLGSPGVTDNGRNFWRSMKRQGKHIRFHPLQGVTRDYGNRVDRRYPEEKTKGRHGRGGRRKSDVPILFMVANRLKDEVSNALLRDRTAKGRFHLTQSLGRAFFEEMAAEERIDEKWHLKPGQKRNEAFDLAYHAKGFAVQMGLEEIDWSAPSKSWLLAGPDNPLIIARPDTVSKASHASSVTPALSQGTSTAALNSTVADAPKPLTRAQLFARYAKRRTGRS